MYRLPISQHDRLTNAPLRGDWLCLGGSDSKAQHSNRFSAIC